METVLAEKQVLENLSSRIHPRLVSHHGLLICFIAMSREATTIMVARVQSLELQYNH